MYVCVCLFWIKECSCCRSYPTTAMPVVCFLQFETQSHAKVLNCQQLRLIHPVKFFFVIYMYLYVACVT